MAHTRRDVCFALPAALALSAAARHARADEPSPGPSRGELFEAFVRPAGIEEYDVAVVSTKEMGIPSNFGFPTDAQTDRTKDPPEARKDTLFGVDISHYSGPVSFNRLRSQGVFFVFIKASQGAASVDDKFAKFWVAAGKPTGAAKIYRGAYHFLSHNVPGQQQADNFIRAIDNTGGLKPDDLPPVVDLEWDIAHSGAPDRWIGVGADQILSILKDCLTRLQSRFHRKPIIYTANSWFSAQTIPKSRFSGIGDYQIWLADYNPKRHPDERVSTIGGSPALLWQFADNGALPGYEGGIDTSVFHGSEAEFRKSFGIA